MNSRKQLEHYGPWAMVTGASDGIGRAMARELAQRGFNVLLVARREQHLRELAVELSREAGVECLAVASDLTTMQGCDTVVAASAGLDIGLLVAAAGFGTSGDFVDSTLRTEREMLAVNCGAVLELVGHIAPRLAQRKRGGIVLFSSVLAFQGVPQSAHYAATKAWVQSFAEGLHRELASRGVDVLASAPGPVNSGFAKRAKLDLGTALAPEVVARDTLDALGRQGTVRPGPLSKVLGWTLAAMPRQGRVIVLGRIMSQMAGRYRNAQSPADARN